MGSDSPIAGRVGKKHVSFRNLAGAPPPNPGSLFVRTKSDQKTAREEKPFRWGFSPVTPSSATTQRGARVGTSSASLILTQASGFARCAAPPSSSANAPLVCLGAAPAGPYFTDSRWINAVRRWKRLSGLARRESGVQAFSPTAKTLAQGRIHSARANEILRGPRAVHRTVRGRIQRGGRSPLIGRRGGGVHRGGTPSKGSLPYACLSAQDGYCLLFPRGKSRSGCGGEAPAAFQSATDTVTRSTPSMARWMSPSMSRADSYWTTSSSTGWVRGWRGVKTVQQSS